MPDSNTGARKDDCRDGQRVIGLAHTGNRGLRTGSWPVPAGYAVVRGQSHVDTDWASGYTKVQCGRTVWFDRGDNRPAGGPGGDFASGHHKGRCTAGEYVAGVAYTGRSGSRRTPDAVLCRLI